MANTDRGKSLEASVVNTQIRAAVLPAFAITYLGVLVLGVSRADLLKTFGALLPGFLVTMGIPLPVAVGQLRSALRQRVDDRPGDRLRRLLELPRRIEFATVSLWLMGAMVSFFVICVWLHLSLLLLIPTGLLSVCYSLLGGVWVSLGIEAVIQVEAVAEFHRAPAVTVRGEGLLWRRQSWFLVYVCALSILTTLLSTWILSLRFLLLTASRAVAVLPRMEDRARWLAHLHGNFQMWFSFGVLLVFAVFSSLFVARRVARYARQGTEALTRSVAGIAKGKPALPQWVSTDELGDLAFALAGTFPQLQSLGSALRGSARQLMDSTEELRITGLRQIRVLGQNLPVLKDAVRSAAHIREITEFSVAQTQLLVAASIEANALGEAGEQALDRTFGELVAIREQVGNMADQTRALEDRVREIASIAKVIKGLASQSNLLALNAAVEAARSEGQGKGFSLVAREIHSLADQSIDSTRRVREILEDLGQRASSTAQLTADGRGRVERSLIQLQDSGGRLSELLRTVRSGAEAAKRIASAIGQQNMGVSEVASSVNQLSEVLERTLEQLAAMDGTRQQLAVLANEVRALVERNGLVD